MSAPKSEHQRHSEALGARVTLRAEHDPDPARCVRAILALLGTPTPPTLGENLISERPATPEPTPPLETPP